MYKKLPYYIFNNIYSKKMYKFFIWAFILIMTFFTVQKYSKINMFEALGLIVTDYNFLCLCSFEFSFLITKKVCDEYDANDYLKIRFFDKKRLEDEKKKSVLLCQTIFFCVSIIIILIFLNLLSTNAYSIEYLEMYKMNSLVFCIYSMVKIYIFTMLISIINVHFMDKIKMWYIYVFNILLYFLILLNSFLSYGKIDFPISYFVGNSIVSCQPYTNYYYDISNYCFHILLIFSIYEIVKRVVKNEVYHNK